MKQQQAKRGCKSLIYPKYNILIQQGSFGTGNSQQVKDRKGVNRKKISIG